MGKEVVIPSVALEANSFVESELSERLANVAERVGSEAIAYYGPITDDVDLIFREELEKLARDEPSQKRLVVILETNGGYIEIVERMVHVIRRHYTHVDWIIPNRAMSAGTVLVMSGDRIFMDYFSVLGPIDPQVPSPDGTQMLPALGYLEQYNRLLEKADNGTLTEIEAMILGTFNQAQLYSFEQARNLSITLLEDWLVQYKFKDWNHRKTSGEAVTLDHKKATAKGIAGKLNATDKWHSHGRGLSIDVIRRELALEIDDLEESPEIDAAVKEYYSLAVDYMRKRAQYGVFHSRKTYLSMYVAA